MAIFNNYFNNPSKEERVMFLESKRNNIAGESLFDVALEKYINELRDNEPLTAEQRKNELQAIFILIKGECEIYRGKYTRKNTAAYQMLTKIIEKFSWQIEHLAEGLLWAWNELEDLLKPSNPRWRGINLPADMLLKGFFIFEVFIPLKEYYQNI